MGPLQAKRNEALAHWLGISGSSYGELAGKLRIEAIRQGYSGIEPDRSRISRWINKGETPRAPMPQLLATTLTSLCELTYTLTPADLGFNGPASPGGSNDWRPAAVVSAIINTTRSDAVTHESAPPTHHLLTGPALISAIQPWLHLPDGPLPVPTRPGRIGLSDVRTIEHTTGVFRSWDNLHGGGLSRRAVVGQLQAVSELTHQSRTSDEVGRQLFAAIADLASVAGWMTHDVGRHEEAQRYFLLGLQAAKQAGPAGAGIAGHLLNCMARQANHLKRPGDALDIVQTAQYGTRKLPPGPLRAILSALEARCHAVLGQLPDASRAIGAAEDALARADNSTEAPPWAAWFDTAEYMVTIGVCAHIAAQHDPTHISRAIELITAGTAQRPAERTRSKAFDQITLARAYLLGDQPEAAADSTTAALALLGRVNSTRVTDRLLELDQELADAPATAVIAETREQIQASLSAR